MALNTILYTVDSSGITPKVRQDGGIQGDHRKTQLQFDLNSELYTDLQNTANDSASTIYYRFDQYNGEGNCESTVPQELVSNTILFPLEEWITRYGGIIKVVLVLTVGDSVETLTELYSFPAILSLRSRPTGSEPDEKQYQSMSLMSVTTVKAAEEAAVSAATAKEAQEKTELAKAALNGEWIFDGESEIDIDLAVDSEMSDASENPVKNKAIKEYVDGKTEALQTALTDLKTELSEQKELWSGSLWMGENGTGSGVIQAITLDEPISKQKHGIVLTFSAFINEGHTGDDSNFNHFFIDKTDVLLNNGDGRAFPLFGVQAYTAGIKYLYIRDQTIDGHISNSADVFTSSSGLKITNKDFVLRRVVGV